MKDLTPNQLASLVHEQVFYADVELVEVRAGAPGERTDKIDLAVFPAFPKAGERMFCYIDDHRRYLRTSTVVSVQIFDDFVRVQTQNSVYVLKNLKLHEGEKQ